MTTNSSQSSYLKSDATFERRISNEVISGSIAGASASMILHPFDYIKVKLQGNIFI